MSLQHNVTLLEHRGVCYPEMESQEQEQRERDRERAHTGIIMWNENTAGINMNRTHSQRSNKSVHYLWTMCCEITVKWLRELHGNFIHTDRLTTTASEAFHTYRTQHSHRTITYAKQRQILYGNMSLCLTWQRTKVSQTAFEQNTVRTVFI